jgi:hypothetical protein
MQSIVVDTQEQGKTAIECSSVKMPEGRRFYRLQQSGKANSGIGPRVSRDFSARP